MSTLTHTHTDDRLTIGCDACIQQAHIAGQRSTKIDGLSATQRLTIANNERLAAGVHPATLHKLRGEGTCGDCAHHHAYHWSGSKYFHKCDLHRLGESHSTASDIRVSWPACALWEAK